MESVDLNFAKERRSLTSVYFTMGTRSLSILPSKTVRSLFFGRIAIASRFYCRSIVMERSTALQQAKALSIDDRIWLVGAIWDSISAEPEQLELTEAQQQELSRRLADRQINPQSVVSWEDIRASALYRAGIPQ
ncbi:addiction module protein [Spirulina sp. 06S082]|uniref:addiction module protein n=1 Tax=Spirulina sp. 06S082 TaxID=3110248 RepID=UPI002B1F661B|nr:addiction module protein [Spirulina sp. 06S082]MEA5467267.1 addiction module protein [Spirulina sp. 06S082]